MNIIAALSHEIGRHRVMIERSVSQLSDEQFFQRLSNETNSIALIVKHLAGNLRSRWSDFLTSDGEKPDRDRDLEFVHAEVDTRAGLMAAWAAAWTICEASLAALTDDDLPRVVTIRGEPHSVFQAGLRSVDHVAYHTGQILLIARAIRPDAPWLTIAPGTSRQWEGKYLKPM